MKHLQRGIGLLLLLAGLAAFVAPDVYSLLFRQQTAAVVSEFRERHRVTRTIESRSESTESAGNRQYSALWKQMQAYNAQIFADKQAGLVDAWSFTENPFGVALEDDLFGCISIPAMDVELPLYLGASETNMAKGAVVLGQTSVPIGGANTNAVIAAHRGYRGAAYFRKIERLSVGDTVEVTNPWETLRYTVTDIAVIRPDDLSAVQIQEGRDLLTLMTCHPYRSGGKYRYVVLCERAGTASTDGDANQTISTNRCEIPAVEAVPLTSSEPELRQENLLRRAGAAVIALLLVWNLFSRPKCQAEPETDSHGHLFRICVGVILTFCLLFTGLAVGTTLRTMDDAAAELQAAIDEQKEANSQKTTIYFP